MLLKKIKRLYRGIVELSEISNVVHSIDLQLSNIYLSPITRHVYLSAFFRKTGGLFEPYYEDWRIKRINKILELYGIDYFKNKNVLELGSGHGDIGAFFAELGANVLSLEGRIQNINYATLKHRKIENFKCIQFDLENDFSNYGKFDLIINLGLLYHLKNVDGHLNCCFKMSDDILLETVVCDSTDPYKIFYCEENKKVDDHALNGIGSRPSPFYIERIAKENSFEAIRYFGDELNSGTQFCYDWEHKDDNRLGDNFRLRRFWRLRKINTL
jgi:SAM-dependent methyltransferase